MRTNSGLLRGGDWPRAIVEPLDRRVLLSAALFSYQALAFVGDPAPGGGTLMNDFEPSTINDRGDVSFISDVSTGEGVFVFRNGTLTEAIRGTSSFGRADINNDGDGAVALGDPSASPIGKGATLYRFSINGSPQAVLTSGVTPAPGGGIFQGTYIQPKLNEGGDLVFSGIIQTTQGIHVAGEPYLGLGLGVYEQTDSGTIRTIAEPGTAAPGGKTFDFAENPWINERGDVAFGAHISGEAIIGAASPQSARIFAGESIYLRKHNGKIISIAHQGDAAPGGGTMSIAFGPVLNNRGQIAFIGDLSATPRAETSLGVFLYSHGKTIAIARPGTVLPGGGKVLTASDYTNDYFVNDRGDVSFVVALDTTHVDHGVTVPDTGEYIWSHGKLSLVARSGTVIPGVGTISQIRSAFFTADPKGSDILAGSLLNNRDQVAFAAVLTDGRDVLLKASPRGGAHGIGACIASNHGPSWGQDNDAKHHDDKDDLV